MKAGTRRFILFAAIVVAALFVGRWTVEFLAERWWAATISDAALSAVTRWWLLGFALNAAAIIVASCWFMLQALAIARTVSAIHITRHIGSLEVREAVPTRVLLWVAIAIGVLLGWISGAGADTWRAPVALAWQGIHWGASEPLLHTDLGKFVTRLPVWELVYDYLLTLVVIGLAFTSSLYFAIGAVRRHDGHLTVNPLARRHLATLLALLAFAIAIGFLMTPMELAASEDLGGSLIAARMRVTTSYGFAAMAVITLILTLFWGIGKRGTMLLLGWVGLFGVLVVDAFVLPGRAIPIEEGKEVGKLQAQFSALAWGLPDPVALRLTDSVPRVTAIWDDRLLRRWEGSRARLLLTATPTTRQNAQQIFEPMWLVAALDTNGRQIEIHGIDEGHTTGDGAPFVTSDLLHRVEAPKSWPTAPAWQQTSGGISTSNWVVRLIIAWARQAGGVLSLTDKASVDWHLDPTERATAILPMVRWLPADVMLDNDRPVWVTQGLIPLDEFPLSLRIKQSTQDLAGLLPAFIAVIDMSTGMTQFYFDPAAGPVAKAWSKFTPGLIAAAASMPTSIREHLTYSSSWADIQLQILGMRNTQLTRARTTDGTRTLVPVWADSGTPALQEVMAENQIVMMRRVHGMPEWSIDQETPRGTSFRQTVAESFKELPLMLHLRDSLTASGDSTMLGSMRWWHGMGLPVLWQPIFALDRQTGPRLLGIATERHHVAALTRTIAQTWNDGPQSGTVSADSIGQSRATIEQARRLIALADSALRRSDLTAFGRYFESLQRVLAGGKP